MPEPLLEAKGIVKSFGRVRALRGASFSVYNALTGKATEKKIGTGFTSLTKDNLAENPDAPYKASC